MKIEVSAIMPRSKCQVALAIVPDASKVYAYCKMQSRWFPVLNGLLFWQDDIALGERKVYRGIFTIEVKS